MPATHTVLIASAQAFDAEQMETLLKREGVRVLRVYDGKTALDFCARHQPSLVVIDEKLPVASGPEVLSSLRADEKLAGQAVVMTSDRVSLSVLQQMMAMGLAGFIQTPFQPDLFLAEIKGILAKIPVREEPPPAPLAPPVSPVSSVSSAAHKTEPLRAEPVLAKSEAPSARPSGSSASSRVTHADADDEGDDDAPPPGTASDASMTPAVGAMESDDEPDIELTSAAGKISHPYPVSPGLLAAIKKRLAIHEEMGGLEKRRTEMLSGEIPDSVKSELLRQATEMNALPEDSVVRSRMTAFAERMTKMRERLAANDADVSPPTPQMEQAWSMAQEQWNLLLEWGDLWPELIRESMAGVKDEALCVLLQKYKFPAYRMFGLAGYHLALETMLSKAISQRKELRQKIDEAQNGGSGFLKKLRTKDDVEPSPLKLQESNILAQCGYLQAEISVLDPMLCKEFWKLYELSSCLLVSGKLDRAEDATIRAFLRYGMIGRTPWFLPPETAQRLLRDCIQDVREVDFTMGAMHVYYADEYIAHAVGGKVLPAIDEDLELNQRNSPRWFADKSHRRVIFCNYHEKALRQLWDELQKNVTELRAEEIATQGLKDKLARSAPDYKDKSAVYAQKVQHCKVEAARYERVIEKIRDKMIPDLEERREMAAEKLKDSTVVQSVFDIARREAGQVHRVTRLCAKLKDPFLPFVLRDSYKPEAKSVNDRASVIAALQDIEQRDPTIFQVAIIPAKKENKKIYARYCPLVLLTPGCGFLGYAWNPRSGVETGKLVFPGYCPRPGIFGPLLNSSVADFRWDTSKAEAGVDVLTSDTLVAAYQTMRWDNRKRSKETREKELIFNEMSDRQNWRRHYCLYLESAMEAGKKLFFRCASAYEVIVRYIPLPEGMERLRK